MLLKVRLKIRSKKFATIIRLKGKELLAQLAFSIGEPPLDDSADLALLLQGKGPDETKGKEAE